MRYRSSTTAIRLHLEAAIRDAHTTWLSTYDKWVIVNLCCHANVYYSCSKGNKITVTWVCNNLFPKNAQVKIRATASISDSRMTSVAAMSPRGWLSRVLIIGVSALQAYGFCFAHNGVPNQLMKLTLTMLRLLAGGSPPVSKLTEIHGAELSPRHRWRSYLPCC